MVMVLDSENRMLTILKSHDYHIIKERLLPIIFQNTFMMMFGML